MSYVGPLEKEGAMKGYLLMRGKELRRKTVFGDVLADRRTLREASDVLGLRNSGDAILDYRL